MTSENSQVAADMSTSSSSRPKSWIEKTPRVCGGAACIRNTRITVWGLVERQQGGLSDAELLRRIPGLTKADLEAAWNYYAAHRPEIDQTMVNAGPKGVVWELPQVAEQY